MAHTTSLRTPSNHINRDLKVVVLHNAGPTSYDIGTVYKGGRTWVWTARVSGGTARGETKTQKAACEAVHAAHIG